MRLSYGINIGTTKLYRFNGRAQELERPDDAAVRIIAHERWWEGVQIPLLSCSCDVAHVKPIWLDSAVTLE